ncbi:MAG: response regulator [Elusimicrobia bacterium]|nr:response regulator [Elusimicrobiota bacterium]
MNKYKILVIEDDLSISKMLKINLEKSGYEVFVSSDGNEGVEIAKQKKPDLIILDIMLPDKNGFVVLEEIKNNQDIAYTPVIVMSGLSISEIKKQIPSYSEKAEGSRTLFFVKKPFEIEELLEEIKDLYDKKIE